MCALYAYCVIHVCVCMCTSDHMGVCVRGCPSVQEVRGEWFRRGEGKEW